jgi:glycosyltransferase involved in cell wall biosynthesis
MSGFPAISVATPLYNKGPFIAETIESVLAQSFADFEIVVVDDGSTDDGVAKLSKFAEPRLRIIQEPNSGVSAARTRALRESRGKYVAFMDADDIWRPDHLFHLAELTRRFQGAALYGNGFIEHSATATVVTPAESVRYRVVEDYFLECAAGRSPFYTSSCMVLRERALELGGFPAGNVCGEDLALWIRLAACAPVAVSDYIGCIYRRGIDSLSWQSSYRNAKDVSMMALTELLEERGDWPDRRRQSAREYFSRLALAHCLDGLRAGEVVQAKHYLLLAASTRLSRRRLWEARFLSFAPSQIRKLFFCLADSRRD